VNCPHCCVKERSNGERQYYHRVLSAMLVHSETKTVLPHANERITKGGGETKNNCERCASKRLLGALPVS